MGRRIHSSNAILRTKPKPMAKPTDWSQIRQCTAPQSGQQNASAQTGFKLKTPFSFLLVPPDTALNAMESPAARSKFNEAFNAGKKIVQRTAVGTTGGLAGNFLIHPPNSEPLPRIPKEIFPYYYRKTPASYIQRAVYKIFPRIEAWNLRMGLAEYQVKFLTILDDPEIQGHFFAANISCLESPETIYQ
jgi:hypothetical protein